MSARVRRLSLKLRKDGLTPVHVMTKVKYLYPELTFIGVRTADDGWIQLVAQKHKKLFTVDLIIRQLSAQIENVHIEQFVLPLHISPQRWEHVQGKFRVAGDQSAETISDTEHEAFVFSSTIKEKTDKILFSLGKDMTRTIEIRDHYENDKHICHEKCLGLDFDQEGEPIEEFYI